MKNIKYCMKCGDYAGEEGLVQSKDYQGLPLRMVCTACYEIIKEKGYDGYKYESVMPWGPPISQEEDEKDLMEKRRRFAENTLEEDAPPNAANGLFSD